MLAKFFDLRTFSFITLNFFQTSGRYFNPVRNLHDPDNTKILKTVHVYCIDETSMHVQNSGVLSDP